MSACEYLLFLAAVGADIRLRNALHRAGADVRSADDLVRFAAGCGYRFAETDVPMAAARTVDSMPVLLVTAAGRRSAPRRG